MSSPFNINRDLQDALKLHRQITESPLVRIQAEARAIAEMQQQMQQAFKPLSSTISELSKTLAIQPRFAAEMTALQKAVQTHQIAFDEVAKLSKLHASIPQFQVPDAFKQMQAQASLISSVYRDFGSQLRSAALIPTTFSAEHIGSTARLIGKWKEQRREVESLMASISLTEAQSSSQEADILDYPAVFDFSQLEEDEGDVFDLPTQNLYYVQRSELILVAKTTPAFLDDDNALNSLPTIQYFSVAQSVCRHVTRINRQCAVNGQQEVFRLTNRLAESLIALPNLVAVTEQQFGEFVDYLYFVVYEGAGKDKLRFLGLIDEADAEPVWMLKHLRNYFTRHDVEHGKDKDIQKKQERLGEVFTKLIGKPLPRNRRDFGNTQLRLLQLMEAMLTKVSDEIERRATSDQETES